MNAKKIHTDEGRTVSVGIESEWKPLSFVQAAGLDASLWRHAKAGQVREK